MPFLSRPLRHARLVRRLAPVLLLATAIALDAGLALAQSSGQPPGYDGYEPAPSYGRPGFYLAISGGAMLKTFESTGDPTVDAALDVLSDAYYIGGKLGSRINRWVATESVVEYGLSGFKAEGAGTFEVKPLYVTGGLRLYATEGRIQPYAAGGVGGVWYFWKVNGTGTALDGEYTSSEFFARVGGGIDIYLTEHIAIAPEAYWNIPTGEFSTLKSVSVGANVMFRF